MGTPIINMNPDFTVVPNIERLGNWIVPPLVGNSAGVASPGTFTMTPGSPTQPAVFSAQGRGPWANGYFYTQLGPNPKATL